MAVALPWSAPADAAGKRVAVLGKPPYAFALASGATAVLGTSGALFANAPRLKVGGRCVKGIAAVCGCCQATARPRPCAAPPKRVGWCPLPSPNHPPRALSVNPDR
jgi:hypothetical protein